MIGAHVTPIDHQYYVSYDFQKTDEGLVDIEVYSPCDGVVTQIQHMNVAVGDPDFGESWMITMPTPDAPPDAIVFSPDGELIAFNRRIDEGRPDGESVRQIFVTSFAPVPEPATVLLAAFGLLAALAYTRRPSW